MGHGLHAVQGRKWKKGKMIVGDWGTGGFWWYI